MAPLVRILACIFVFVQRESVLSYRKSKRVQAGRFSEEVIIAAATNFVHRLAVPEKVDPDQRNTFCSEFKDNFLANQPDFKSVGLLWGLLCKNKDFYDRWKKMGQGCLYLPSDGQMEHMRSCLQRPNPWHYINFMEDLFFPTAGNEQCPSETKNQTFEAAGGSTFTTCDNDQGFATAAGGCVKATKRGDHGTLAVYKLDGLMGLDKGWENMMKKERCERHLQAEQQGRRGASMVQEEIMEQIMVNQSQGMWKANPIPIKFIVCDGGHDIVKATDDQIKKNLEVLNTAFRGQDTCQVETYDFFKYNTGIQFSLHSIDRVTLTSCDWDCTYEENIEIVMSDPDLMKLDDNMLKVMICETDSLGLASFPWDPPNERIHIINYQTLPGGEMLNYNEGKTLVHEMGHYFGLFHTFDGGCEYGDEEYGDEVSDTNAEEYEFYGCPSDQSELRTTCGSPDPVHNYMDYTDDACMCHFTWGQLARIWQSMQAFMPNWYAKFR